MAIFFVFFFLIIFIFQQISLTFINNRYENTDNIVDTTLNITHLEEGILNPEYLWNKFDKKVFFVHSDGMFTEDLGIYLCYYYSWLASNPELSFEVISMLYVRFGILI